VLTDSTADCPNQAAENGRRELDPVGSDEVLSPPSGSSSHPTVLGIPAVNNGLSLDIGATGSGC
jgi:hypothetical protein